MSELLSRGRTPETIAWGAIQQRCKKGNENKFPRYAGRGITVCQRWAGSFDSFLSDMGKRPSSRHSIDRKNNDGGYWCGKPECSECGPLKREPNCRWATMREQRRNACTNHFLVYKAERLILEDWATRVGLESSLLYNRIRRGWSVADALETPSGEMRRSIAKKKCEHCGEMFSCTGSGNAANRRFCSTHCRCCAYDPNRPSVIPPKASEAAIAILRETDNPAVMKGDERLLHMIAERCGWKHDGPKTSLRVLNALSKSPGQLIPSKVVRNDGQTVRVFALPECAG